MKIYVNARDFKVFLSITYKYKRFLISTGLQSTEKFEGMIFPRSDKSARAKTARLAKIYGEVEEYLLSHNQESPEEMKMHLKEIIVGEKRHTGLYLHEYIKRLSTTKRSWNTQRNYGRVAAAVYNFDKSCRIENVDKQWLKKYAENELNRGRVANGVSTDIVIIKGALKRATEEELIDKYKVSGFHLQREETKKRCLTLLQMRQLRDADLVGKAKLYRDFFMLGFYLIGINVSDLLMLKKEDYKDGRISYKRNKTGRLYDIKVEPEAREIMKRYMVGKNGLLLSFLDASGTKEVPLFTNNANRALRRIGKKTRHSYFVDTIPIEPKITTYWNRHTWATFAAKIGISMETIGRALGHSIWDNTVTAVYIKYDHSAIDKANRRVIDYLNKDKATQAK